MIPPCLAAKEIEIKLDLRKDIKFSRKYVEKYTKRIFLTSK